ncbi:sensor histidine kinase [Noviherbaspirillum pedocola]|uniref:histidine kinase n=1 Tax=Noviherbaspirillum pedocola TaxID=2801341 RepID=A0A934W5D3_9BURK|nr:ATP-binding protein [Noviherbaspirillum pedocola]MBK4733093.1 PAS domain-containing protein [Noviherbaspirillum pedocola]
MAATDLESQDAKADVTPLSLGCRGPSADNPPPWLHAVVAASMDAVVVLDHSEHIALCNPAAETLFARPAEQMLGKSVDLLFWPQSGTAQRLAETGPGEQLQLQGCRANQAPFRCEARVAKLGDRITGWQLLVMREPVLHTPSLRRRAESFQQAFEMEKRRVSRELYDDLGQRLSVLKLDLDWLQRASPTDAHQRPARIAQMQALLDSVIIRTKAIASGLRPPLLDDLGLLAAVRWLAQSFERQTGVRVEVHHSPQDFHGNDAADTAIYRTVQEALRNVQRHAQASHVQIAIRRAHDRITVSVQDNGVGMPQDAEHKVDCFGLAAMQERIYTLGGTFDMHSRRGHGSVIHVSIPI